jgi:hypothetical protein
MIYYVYKVNKTNKTLGVVRMLEIKQKGNRYYRFSRMQFRSFPIKKSEALELIAKGEAVLVERFLTDPTIIEEVSPVQVTKIEVIETVQEVKEEVKQPETKSNKVVNFSDRFQAKQEKKSFDDAMSHYINNILPNLKLDELKRMMDAGQDSDNFKEELIRATLRISLEKATREYKGGLN